MRPFNFHAWCLVGDLLWSVGKLLAKAFIAAAIICTLAGCEDGLGVNATVNHQGGQKVEVRHDHYFHFGKERKR